MNFLYNTAFGRVFLKMLLHAGVLKLLAGWMSSPFSRWLIRPYVKKNKIDMRPFDGQKYDSFADFFARKQKVKCRGKNPHALISPCDGLLSVVPVKKNVKFHVKNSWYSIHDLVPDKSIADSFSGGLCMIFRLRAADYHHFYYIDDCFHGKCHFIPGTLHSVQPAALEKEPVFRLNRRMWSIMDTKNFGRVAQIEVGAVLVGGIVHEAEEKWKRRGEEMGHFELCGSTIILLFPNEIKEKLKLLETYEDGIEIFGEYPVRIGEVIGYVGD